MDVGEAEQKYRSGPGNPAYSRRMLLRIVIMASADAIWSSRKIAKLYGDKRGDELPPELNTQEKIRDKNLKFREFHTRGIENVQIEHNLVCTAHNLKVMWCNLCRSAAALCKIEGLVAYFASKVSTL
jgi:hypothetical protein